LASTLGLSRARVSHALDDLRSLGYCFTVDAREHVHLTAAPDRMIDTEILSGLKTRVFGRHLHCYKRVGSTNTRAAELADSGAPEGTLVVAEEQVEGRGRLGRGWHSAQGLGIWSSVILRPQLPLPRAYGLSLLAALAFAEIAASELGLEVDLKWPNDGLIAGRKILGVLSELSTEKDRLRYAICGMGINVSHQLEDFPPELRRTAGSLAMAAGHPVERVAFFRVFLAAFERLYRGFRREGIAPYLDDYRRRSLLLGREVSVVLGRETIRGKAVAIDENGALIVRVGRQDRVVFAGEASLQQN
jgi:BirA family biotin operon repressor/biotin-[acetyl-CoA-carboxylase] ligase